MLLHELAHVDADEVILAVEQEARQRLAQLGLAHARGAQEEEGAGGPVGVRQARARAPDGVGDSADGLVLADHALVQLVLHLQQLVALALHQLGHGDAGGTRHHLGNLLGAHLGAQERGSAGLALGGLGVLGLLQALLQAGQLAVLQLGNLVEVALAGEFGNLELDLVDLLADVRAALGLGLLGLPDLVEVGELLLHAGDVLLDQAQALLGGLVLLAAHGLALDLELDEAAVEAVHDLGLGVHLDLDPGGGLVDEVDGLVGQEAVGDVAVRQLCGSDDGRVGDVDAVVDFVLLLQAAQDGDGGLHAGLAHEDLLEAALQGSVLLDVFAVLVQGGGAHAVELAARKGRLEHVAGVHGALGLAGADHGVELVDEDDGLALVLGEFVEDALQALLEFAAVLGTGEQGGHVQGQHALALEGLGDLAGDDALGQALDDGGLADAGLADEHRIVLGAALQDLDGAADFLVASDDGVELAQARALGEVEGVFLEGFALALGLGAVDALAAAHGVDGGFDGLARDAVAAREVADLGLAVGQGQQEELAGDELVVALDGFLLGGLQQLGQLGADLHLVVALDLRQPLDGRLGRIEQPGHVGAGTLEQRARAIGLAQHGHQKVNRLDVGVVVAQRERLRIGKGFLELGGEFVLAHE
ncbi:hypothetical protein APY03_1758 [Variovorax sp. WDL1]|nr:hypothetical protein APY03_1758 [Variovorax sp. WDL1]